MVDHVFVTDAGAATPSHGEASSQKPPAELKRCIEAKSDGNRRYGPDRRNPCGHVAQLNSGCGKRHTTDLVSGSNRGCTWPRWPAPRSTGIARSIDGQTDYRPDEDNADHELGRR